MVETWVQSLGGEDPLEDSMATHSQYSCLENAMNRESFKSAKWEWEHLKWYFNQITVETLFRFCLNKWWIQRHIWYKWEYLKMDLVLDIKELILILLGVIIRSDQLLSRVRLFMTPWITARQASLSIINSQSLPKLVHWVGDAIQPSHPLSSPSRPAFNLTQHHSLFQWVSSLNQVAKVL